MSTGSRTDGVWASLDVVRAELDIEMQAQAKRADSADARAGVLLGAAGAVAALAVNSRTPYALPAAGAALVAAILAARALRPMPQHTVDPVELRRWYVADRESATRQAVLDRRVDDFARNDAAVDRKVRRLHGAIFALLTAIALAVLGAAARELMTIW
jgi:hypothetical protein